MKTSGFILLIASVIVLMTSFDKDTEELEDDRFKFEKTFKITVPQNYKHETQLATFSKNHKSEFYGYNDAITDNNFAKVTNKLVPGKTYTVKIFSINGSVTSEDCLAFLKSQKCIFVGAQGASLAYELAKGELISGKWNVSFDEKYTLWIVDDDGNHGVPCIGEKMGHWGFSLELFETEWTIKSCLMCFTEG